MCCVVSRSKKKEGNTSWKKEMRRKERKKEASIEREKEKKKNRKRPLDHMCGLTWWRQGMTMDPIHHQILIIMPWYLNFHNLETPKTCSKFSSLWLIYFEFWFMKTQNKNWTKQWFFRWSKRILSFGVMKTKFWDRKLAKPNSLWVFQGLKPATLLMQLEAITCCWVGRVLWVYE